MQSSSGILRAVVLILTCGLPLYSTLLYSDSAVTPGSKAATMENCIAPTTEIRRNHMDHLQHDRIKVVQQGVRSVKYSLAECVDCHAEKDDKGGYHPINAEGQFCSGCHQYVAVSLTCFQCHSKKPETQQMNASLLAPLPASIVETSALTAEELAQLHASFREE